MILRNLFLVAAVLWTMGAAAAGKVEVTGDTSHGTVQTSVQGPVVTLMVTPAEGYYIRKSDITASKSFMPMPEARRKSKGVPVSDDLKLVGNDPDDLSQPRTYTVTMPGEEYDVLLDVQFTERQRITELMVTLSETLFVYNEQEQRPKVLVAGLQEGVDFSVTYAEPTSVTSGTYTLTVAGRSTWQGAVERTYKVFAGGKAEVNKNITGGIIATSVEGLKLMLTVTPADGYYISKKDILVEKTFMPVGSARRAAPISEGLTIDGDDPDDLSLPRTYTVELPGWEYDALVNAKFTTRQKLTAGMVSLSATSFVYNGKDQQPQISVRGLVEGRDYIVVFKGTSWSDVCTYSVDIVGRSTWIETVSRTYTITKAPSVVTEDPKALNLIYDGEPQALVSAGDCTGGTLLYSLDGKNYLPEFPKATVVGSYTVYYKVQGDSNHTDTEAKTVSVAIDKKEITISGITAENKVYDRTTAVTLNFDAVVFGGLVKGDELTVTAKGAFVDANAGKDKEVTISELVLGGQSIANYRLASDGQQTAAKATIMEKVVDKPVVELSESSFVYDGTAKTVAVAVKDGETVILATEYTVGYEDNVNVGTAKVIIKDVEGGNYIVSGQATFSITKATAAISAAPVALVLSYTGEPQTLISAGDATGGILLYSLDGENYLATLPTATAAGTYTVYYKVVGDANHSDSEVSSLSVTISPKVVDSPVIELSQQSYGYDGTAKEPEVTVKDGSEVIPASEYSVSYASNVNAGEATVTITDKEGGNYTVSGQTTFVIEKGATTVKTAPQAKALTYNREAQALVDPGTGEGGEMLYSLDANASFSVTIPTGTDVGTYTVYYKVVGDANHSDSEVLSLSVTISPKVVSAPVMELSQQNYVYDGTAKEPVVMVKDGTDIIPASEYSVSYASNVNAGEAIVSITDEEGNYIVNGQTIFTITKAVLNAIADNRMMEKGEPMPELTVRYKGFIGSDGEEVLLTSAVARCEEITDTVPGVYQILVSGGEALNYDFNYVNGTLTIFVPIALADEAGNEVEASVMVEEDTCHVVITELTTEMLNGTQDIPAELKSGEGDTYQVTEVASEAFEEMPSNVIIELPDGVSTTNPVTNVINGDGTCETLDLTDVDGFGVKKTLEVEEVIYEREIDCDVMTVCLPYSIEVPENVVVFELDADADGGVSFVSVSGDSLEAYQPYLMQPKVEEALARRAGDAETATLSLGAKNVTIAPTQEDVAVSVGVFVLCGTVRGLTHAEGLELKAYVMQPDYTWKMTASRAPEDANKPYLGAFQAYMQLIGGTGDEVIDTEMNDLTAILHVTKEAAPAIDGWYDLMGRKLLGKPSKGGLYIYQGKKVSF